MEPEEGQSKESAAALTVYMRRVDKTREMKVELVRLNRLVRECRRELKLREAEEAEALKAYEAVPYSDCTCEQMGCTGGCPIHAGWRNL